jgi:hypothetical protein
MLTSKWADIGSWSPLKALKRVGETKWLIDGVIPAGSINWMVASPSSFKTFLALDMGACIATGRAWHGRETDKALVLYVDGEGDDDIHVRRAAADMAVGDTGPMCIVQMRPRLDEPHGLASLLALAYRVTAGRLNFPEVETFISEISEKYLTPEEATEYEKIADTTGDEWEFAERVARHRYNAWDDAMDAAYWHNTAMEAPAAVRKQSAANLFVVIDTYSQTSADDAKATVSRYIKTLRDLQEKAVALGGTITVLVIDHTTKSGESYMGSLAKEGDSDTMMEVDRHCNDYSLTLKSLKMRGGVSFAPVHLDLVPFTLEGFTDALDRPLASLIVVDGEQAHRIRKAAGSSGDTAAALVLTLLTESGACSKGDLRLAFLAHKTNEGKKTDSVSRAFNRALGTLAENSLVSVDSAGVVSLMSDAELV